jgi:hypothetical protein
MATTTITGTRTRARIAATTLSTRGDTDPERITAMMDIVLAMIAFLQHPAPKAIPQVFVAPRAELYF